MSVVGGTGGEGCICCMYIVVDRGRLFFKLDPENVCVVEGGVDMCKFIISN